MITIENLTKSYGSQKLFDNINFKINPRERAGLVGRNGHGKTTLFRLITGDEHPDSGSVIIPKHYRIGYVKQDLGFTEDTVLKECMLGLHHEESGHTWKAEKILSGLGFTSADFERRPEEFSGGYQVRLNLAKVLVSEPDMLLLDEPTNYLDIMSIRWIERFLLSWPGELLLISHDRSFMDRLVTHTIGIHRKKTRKIEGDTGKFYSQIARDEEIYEKTRVNDERKRKDIELFVTRFRAKARLAGLVQSRVKALEKKEKQEKLENIKDLDFYFNNAPFNARQIMSVSDISFSYDKKAGHDIISRFNITIGARDRICVVGKNGKGKTTLLRLLAGDLKPAHGEVIYHPSAKPGFFVQTNVETLADKKTVEEEILCASPDADRQQARNICGAMMFEGDDALKKIEVLSGGEKSRVMLGKLLITPVNLLLLDEPTNHLDMESCDALLAAIDNFDGAVIIVTHNEMFLHALAERLIVFQNGVSVFEGSYQDFLDRKGWEGEAESARPAGIRNGNGDSSRNKKDIRRQRSEIIKERSQVLKPLENKIAQLMKEIERHETGLAGFNEAIIEASQTQDGKRISELSQSIHTCKSAIDGLFEELERSTAEQEQKQEFYNRKLELLESGS
ncbi:MAG: ATP-binding cassette domain-containing protein [Spirochaetes bacterium]|nr:ATP-binding cassette domain-containing protein [Spirochaetota bacterium]